MTAAALFYGPPTVAWAAAAYKLPAVRRKRADPGPLFYWLTLTTLALALTLLVPSIYVWIDHVTGVSNLARLLGDGFGLVTAWSVQSFLAYLNFPAHQAKVTARRLAYLLIPTVIALSVLFAWVPVEEGALSFVQRSGDIPSVLAYRLVFLGFLGLAAFNVMRFSWRYAKVASRPSLRVGLRLDALGGVVGLLFVTHEGLFVLSRAAGSPYPIPQPVTVSGVLIVFGVLLTVGGSTMPAWGPRAGVPWLYHRFSAHCSLARLYPLWLALYRATPEIALLPPPNRLVDLLNVRDANFRLYRRVIEIRDGRLALRPYGDSRVGGIARELGYDAGLSEVERQALIEAAMLTAAIRRKATGQIADHAPSSYSIAGGTDIADEVTELERVAYWFARSCFMRSVLARMDQMEDGKTDDANEPNDINERDMT